ncbi:MAG: hypothetical protein JXR25_06500 [Pontiellaceae bacterium]|nr:hypothetical protein [Pontiellaceae bacterium]MBN2784459.1 hypothetical protein [Pontiellaceae bacterium]
MKKITLALFCSMVAMTFSVQAGAISDQLKAADCNFTILRKGKPVNVIKQVITLRAISEKGFIDPVKKMIQDTTTTDYPYSTGYRSYHVEFAYTGDRIEFKDVDKIEFYIGKTLAYVHPTENITRRMADSDERTEQKTYYFSINLQGIPLLMLDDITTINIFD